MIEVIRVPRKRIDTVFGYAYPRYSMSYYEKERLIFSLFQTNTRLQMFDNESNADSYTFRIAKKDVERVNEWVDSLPKGPFFKVPLWIRKCFSTAPVERCQINNIPHVALFEFLKRHDIPVTDYQIFSADIRLTAWIAFKNPELRVLFKLEFAEELEKG